MDKYEKMHKDALDIAKTLIKRCPDAREWVESKFPELKESEDETIRKDLINTIYIAYDCGCSLNKEQRDKYIAWLEKQGVQESPEWDEADVNRFNNLIFLVECSKEGEATKQGFIKFIKRLRGMKCENRWKPTVEQLDALREVISGYKRSFTGLHIPQIVETLYNDLKFKV